MNLLILVVLAALLGVIECGENANKVLLFAHHSIFIIQFVPDLLGVVVYMNCLSFTVHLRNIFKEYSCKMLSGSEVPNKRPPLNVIEKENSHFQIHLHCPPCSRILFATLEKYFHFDKRSTISQS